MIPLFLHENLTWNLNHSATWLLLLGFELHQRIGRDETCDQARIHCISEKVTLVPPVSLCFWPYL